MNDVTVLGEQERTSRGRVRCDYCGRAIAKGTRYYEQRCTAYRDIWTWRTCPVCADAYAHVEAWVDPDYHYDDPIGPEDYREWANEVMGDIGFYNADQFICVIGEHVNDLVGVFADGLTEDAAEAAEADRTHPLNNPDAIAAFIWRMRTSTALHPHGIPNI